MSQVLCPTFGMPLENCMLCSGEACNFCGAGCWSNRKDCEHDALERHQPHETTIVDGECPRCQIAVCGTPVLHSYEWTPPPEFMSETVFWNVAEIRLRMKGHPREVALEEYPYSPGFVELTSAHDVVWGHVPHIPPDRVRPSLVGNLSLPDPRSPGERALCSVMLDGHHSALSRIMLRQTVELEIVPEAVLLACARFSREQLVHNPSAPILVFEGGQFSLL